MEPTHVPQEHVRRPEVRCIGVEALAGWLLKWYLVGSAEGGDKTTLREAVRSQLPALRRRDAVGFVICPRVTGGAVRLGVGLWSEHRLSLKGIMVDGNSTTSRLTGEVLDQYPLDIWELGIVAHEREAFLAHLRLQPDAPGPSHYLGDVMSMWGETAEPDRRGSPRETLRQFSRAWAWGDVDALMGLMSDDPIYRSSAGPGPGTEFRGRAQVRAGLERILAAVEPARVALAPSDQPAATFFGDQALSYWSMPCAREDGTTAMAPGVDVITFASDGRIAVKDAYRKTWHP